MTRARRLPAAAAALCGVLLLLVPTTGIAIAQTTGPTLAKCTCHFDEKAPPVTDGAQAVNATLCVQMMDKGHKWCEITVACLRGNIGPQCPAGSAPQAALLPLYAFAIAETTQTNGPENFAFIKQFERFGEVVERLSKENSVAIATCVELYRSRSKESKSIISGEFACAYDPTTGWLAIIFISGPDLVQFSFGARE